MTAHPAHVPHPIRPARELARASRRVRRRLRARLRAWGAILCLVIVPSAATGADALPPYEVPERTDLELSEATRSACLQAEREDKPLLLEFSAEWCSDCRGLARLKQEPRLEEAVARYVELGVNVGRFDRHPALLRSFGVSAIAHWAVVAPDDCSLPVYMWRRVASRTLEPETGAPVRSEELADWLDQQREAAGDSNAQP